MRSIRTKITVMTTCMVIVTMIVAAVYGAITIRDMGHSNANETLLLMCETGEKNLDNYFNSVEQSVEMVAAYVESDLDGIDEAHLQAHIDRASAIFERVIPKTNGVLTYYYRIDPEITEKNGGFWYVLEDDGKFRSHKVTDITQYDSQDTSQLVWFTVPKATGESVWLPPYITENLQVEVLSYNVPIYYEDKFVGVVGIEIECSTMAEQVNNITLYENGYAFITDADGTVVYHPRTDVALVEERPKVPDALMSGESPVTYTFEGEEKVAVWLPLENGMRLNVSVPVDEINEGWISWAMNLSGAFLAMLIIFIGITMAFAVRITKPLRDLTEAAERVDKGDYDCALECAGNDEVATLTRTFNMLIGHLKVYIDKLNDKANVDALTSLRNKGAFDTFIENLQAQVNEQGGDIEFAVCSFDCNRMKSVNDEYGHDKGDIHLKDSAHIICEVFEHSPVFRVGGDEFVAVLRGSDYERRDELVEVFDQACAKVREKETDPWKQIDISRGVAVYDAREDASVNDVIRRADKLMYEHKRLTKGENATR